MSSLSDYSPRIDQILRNATTVIEVRNSDFQHGTVHFNLDFTTYRIMEDIVFQPNPDLLFAPQVITEDVKLGFHSVISCTANNAVIDLQGHTISMSRAYTFFQRFGTLIALTDAPFMRPFGPFVGPAQVHSASNVVIMNGSLRRSSHHCIHGINNENIFIQNIVFSDYEVAAIHLNGPNIGSIVNCTMMNPLSSFPLSGRFTSIRNFQFIVDQIIEAILGVVGLEDNAAFDIHYLRRLKALTMDTTQRVVGEFFRTEAQALEDIPIISDEEPFVGRVFYPDLSRTGFQGVEGSAVYGIVINRRTMPGVFDLNKRRCPYGSGQSNYLLSRSDEISVYDPRVHVARSESNTPPNPTLDPTKTMPSSMDLARGFQILSCNIAAPILSGTEFLGFRLNHEFPDNRENFVKDSGGGVIDYNLILETWELQQKGEPRSNLLWYQLQVQYIADQWGVKNGVSNMKPELRDLLMNLYENNYPNIPDNIDQEIRMREFDKEAFDYLVEELDYTVCGHMDSQGHTPKGVFGIRADAVHDLEISNCIIEPLINRTGPGFNIPENYLYQFSNRTMPGFNGNNTTGILVSACSNVSIRRVDIGPITSLGSGYGVRVINGSHNVLVSDTITSEIDAPSDYDLDTSEKAPNWPKGSSPMNNYPNRPPQSAPFYVEEACEVIFTGCRTQGIQNFKPGNRSTFTIV